ncbi:MAG: hypothetical protein IJ733_05890 [Lachnospiraceae bacterium]|nr:hypothetical protein [Lachnospiraceae bacterium]
MEKASVLFNGGGIYQYDGYLGDSIWEQPENESTYYSSVLDYQCTVPSRSIQEIKESIGLPVSTKTS